MKDYDAVVIGAGLGGISCAAILAKRGYKTLVCENASQVGGCCSSYDSEGYRFDIGASVVELSWVIDEVFRKLDRRTSDYIDMIPIEPIYGFMTADGKRFSYPVDIGETREIIKSLSEEDAINWDRFSEAGSELMVEGFSQTMTRPLQSMGDLIKMGIQSPKMAKYMKHFFLNFETTLCSYFSSDIIRASMSLQSYFIGLPPALCPGYVAFLAYTEHEGIFYPKGGMIEIPKSIARAFEECGGEIRLNSTVSKVLTESGRACGVELEDGTQITSNVVVSNINAKTLYLELVGEEKLPVWAKRAIKSIEVSMPSPMIMLGLDAAPDLDAHHTICYTTLDDMNSVWFDDYLNNRIPEFGAGLISWPTHADPSLAPEGHHCLNMIAFAPYEPAIGSWDEIKEQYLESQFEVLERNFGLNIRDHVKVAKVNTPKDFEKLLRHPRGAVYGLQSDITCSAAFRPRSRSKVIKGLYLTGASTHLGGGVAPTIGSGVVAADFIEKDQK